MSFNYNATGIDTNQKSFDPLPDGKYTLRITKAEEAQSKNKNFMAKLECEVINNQEFNGRKVFHNVTFMSDPQAKGAGMSVHFLKTIGQPWEGEIEIDVPAWEGATFVAKLAKASYTNKAGMLVHKNEIKAVEPVEEGIPF